MDDAPKSLTAMAQVLIQSMLEDMEDMTPREKQAMSAAIKSLSESLPGLSGMNDTVQTLMQGLLLRIVEKQKQEQETHE